MSVVMIFATLVLGLILLTLGIVIKKKWLKIISIIPLTIFLFQLVFLLGWLL
ncbi:hypothetical protein WAK64_19885 [Bacillus spongiae]|uniref:Uncharacterized protein n=1 Tax=Bacillus spongiae TaxID=2683610 RepID=A0ABU8HJH5_9BACI